MFAAQDWRCTCLTLTVVFKPGGCIGCKPEVRSYGMHSLSLHTNFIECCVHFTRLHLTYMIKPVYFTSVAALQAKKRWVLTKKCHFNYMIPFSQLQKFKIETIMTGATMAGVY